MIEVRISHAEIEPIKGLLNKDEHMRNRVRSAGIKLQGLMLIGGLKGGLLVIREDDLFGELVYQYYPAGETPK